MTETATKPTATPASRRMPALLVLGALIALSYLSADFIAIPQPYAPIYKAAGIVLLGCYALSSRAWAAGVALLLSSVGDVMLELDPPQMIAGMAAFGLAHVAYIVGFAGLIQREGLNVKAWPLALLVLAVSIAMLVWFLPDMGKLTAPGLGYQAIITTMVALALLSRAPVTTRIAAVVFMLSDSLIALTLYKHIAMPPGSVWITYAVAQILLAEGFARDTRARLAARPA